MTILVVVESPGKISKIKSILGKGYDVQASMGIFRDLDPKKMSIDFDNNFEPIYILTKPDVAKKLKASMSKADVLYIATDPDREGEGMAQSVHDIVKPKQYKRVTFQSVTKKAITDAINNAGKIDKNMVNSQKGRRVLDRLYGFLISPVLQKQLGGGLSAGRTQSVATKIVIDKENEINQFMEDKSDATFFKVNGTFFRSDSLDKENLIKATLYQSTDKKAHSKSDAYKGKVAQIPLDEKEAGKKVKKFLNKAIESTFAVHSVASKMTQRSPAPPFTTSTLQQEANRKLKMPIDMTMRTAQKLYEGGYITYMRTDSVEISAEGHDEIKKVIRQEFGKEYYQKNVYKNKSSSSQEAHEAVRPTHPELISLDNEINDSAQIELYDLIWKRTIASQMKPADIKITTVQISVSKYIEDELDPFYYFQTQIEKVIFPGFMIVYVESTDDPEKDDITRDFKGKIPKEGIEIPMEQITAKQEYLRPPTRFTQASLVKKLEALEIGRPSTYVNIVKTIMDRKYVEIGDVTGVKKSIFVYKIQSKNGEPINNIVEEKTQTVIGREKKKLLPTKLGISVTNFLLEHFSEMMDYKFTAKIEQELDKIARGEKKWQKVVDKFYSKLKPRIEELSIATSTDRLLGEDKNGNQIYACAGRYGPFVKRIIGDKSTCASITDQHDLETITLKEALRLLRYPKLLGKYKKKEVFLRKGERGFYLSCDKQTYSVPEEHGNKIDLETAITIMEQKKSSEIAEFNLTEGKKKIKAIILEGQFGPYIRVQRGKTKTNYSIPRNYDPKNLTDDIVLEIISQKKKPFVKGGSKTQSLGETRARALAPAGKTQSLGKTAKKSGSKTAKKSGSGPTRKKSTPRKKAIVKN